MMISSYHMMTSPVSYCHYWVSVLGKMSGKVSRLHLWCHRSGRHRNLSSRSYDNIAVPTFCLKGPSTSQCLISAALSALSLPLSTTPPRSGKPSSIVWLNPVFPFYLPAFPALTVDPEASLMPSCLFQRKEPCWTWYFLDLSEWNTLYKLWVCYLTFKYSA